ncbi:hypothetical protein [Nocardioides sp. TF02-7]|uniref:hypothetical protein n=1 Tax=Nocardioides sp. TF02-7 TaxID=2917724 RepID=UPI001F0640F0|nr:hypothetical protein [Nocardioides sp. TF02-7]UMG91471.1 hypothetical protein MF408_15220 [Nocardioides sp. TF02-7]
MSPGARAPRAVRRALPAIAVLAAAATAATALTGCGLVRDLLGGSTMDDAFEYLPADSFRVTFSDRASQAERLGVDDVGPRDATEEDAVGYLEALAEEVAGTRLTPFVVAAREAALNDLDVEWEGSASWGDPDAPEGATVWKVGDDLDFDALADELAALGYEEQQVAGFDVLTGGRATDPAAAGYPPFARALLLDPDDGLVVAAAAVGPLETVADVINDDADSLADDDGFGEVADAVEDVEYAVLEAGPAACASRGDRLPRSAQSAQAGLAGLADLGRPERRALLVRGEDPRATYVLEHADDEAAEADRDAREALLADGTDPVTGRPFAELGELTVERDGSLVLVEADVDPPSVALGAFQRGGGPAVCAPG